MHYNLFIGWTSVTTLLCEGSSHLRVVQTRQVDFFFVIQPAAETTHRHGNERNHNAGGSAVAQAESFNGGCTAKAQTLC